MQNIAYHIRTLRKAKGMTQEELAAAVHITRQAVSSWERGGSCPPFCTCLILDEIRNGAYWQTHQESMEQPEPTQDNE